MDTSPWGKRRGLVAAYPLIWHLLDTGAVALALWDRFLSEGQRRAIAAGLGTGVEHARMLVGLWAALHDLGKLTPSFQHVSEDGYAGVSGRLRADEARWQDVPHDVASMRGAVGPLEALGYEMHGGDPCSPGWRVAQILGGHHGRFHTCDFGGDVVAPRALDDLGGCLWLGERGAYVEEIHRLLGCPAPPGEVSAAAAVVVTGLVIVADWLASQEDYLNARLAAPAEDPEAHWKQAVEAAYGLVADAGLDASGLEWEPFDYGRAFGIAEPNPLQASVLTELSGSVSGPGILVVTAAMGDGKTELAVAAERVVASASGTEGFFFALPTMATGDQMHLRMRRYAGAATRGPAPVTLVHSTAWLNSAYADASLATSPGVVTGERQAAARTAAVAWLRHAKRPLLARLSVGTIDQALTAVLPVRHNALRMLALSGKTVIVDEAHAYDPYMQVLLGRLLSWLAAYGCSVILLSATLPGSVANRYVDAYLHGAGRRRRERTKARVQVPYPGWMFVDAATATPTRISEAAAQAHARDRAIELAVELHPFLPTPDHPDAPSPGTARRDVLAALLGPLSREGGTAAVVCTTVDEAQDTYTIVRDWAETLGEDAPRVELLHARFPGDQREEKTASLVGMLGREGERPSKLVVVATQIVEQSLDLDVDLLISDLAPVALLLQRAGRCWRHEKQWMKTGRRPGGQARPSWAAGPKLAVLVPSDELGELALPRRWLGVYHEYLLRASHQLLTRYDGAVIRVPDDVQGIVEEVHGSGSEAERAAQAIEEKAGAAGSRAAWDGENLAKRSMADCVVVPGPTLDGRDLAALHPDLLDEAAVATRLGIDSVRVLPVFRHPDGRRTLDRVGRVALPEQADAGERFSAWQVRQVLVKTIPVRATKLAERGDETAVPPAWQDHPWLGAVVLLPHTVHADGRVTGCAIGSRTFLLDPELGLVIQ